MAARVASSNSKGNMGQSKCDKCGEIADDIDVGFSPGVHEMGHDCGGTWRVAPEPQAGVYAVITDRTPNRCTVASIEYSREEAAVVAERLDTGINGMPAEVMRVAPGDPGNLEPGDRAWHDGEMCWSEAGRI